MRLHRNRWFKLAATTLVIVALSEVQLYLHAASPFRFGLGAIILMAAALLDNSISPALLGVSSGGLYLAERVARALLQPRGNGPMQLQLLLEDALQAHYPAALALGALGLCLWLLRIRRWTASPFLLYAALLMSDVVATFSQFLVRPAWRTYSTIQIILVIAAIRAATVSGIYWTWRAKAAAVAAAEQQKEYERLLLLLADLNSEVFYLQKSGQDLSRIMAASVQLVKAAESERVAEVALAIAKDAHDLRADYRRIANGLARLVQARPAEVTMPFSQVLDLVVKSGRAAAIRMGKTVTFEAGVEPDFPTAAYMIWVAILNNLVTNSLEAFETGGQITVAARVKDGYLSVDVRDNGPGVDLADIPILFRPGFTTKFDPDSGHASRGLGLAQVASLVSDMQGSVEVASAAPGNMCMRIRVPYAEAAGPFPGMDVIA